MSDARWRDRLRRDPRAVLGSATLALLFTAAVVGPWLLGVDPRVQADPATQAFLPPSTAHWLGTDALSRDVFARALAGARVSLSVAAVAASVAFGLGLSWGVLAGWRGGWIDVVLMRLVDVLLAVPRVLVLLIVLGFWDERTPVLLGLVLGATGWMSTSRLVRADVRTIKRAPWVEAARRLGASEWRIVRVHILPVAVGHASVAAALAASHALILDAGLAAIGMGIALPQASWGTMLASAVSTAQWTWWLWLAPGVPLIVASAAFTAVADAARTTADPRLRTVR